MIGTSIHESAAKLGIGFFKVEEIIKCYNNLQLVILNDTLKNPLNMISFSPGCWYKMTPPAVLKWGRLKSTLGKWAKINCFYLIVRIVTLHRNSLFCSTSFFFWGIVQKSYDHIWRPTQIKYIIILIIFYTHLFVFPSWHDLCMILMWKSCYITNAIFCRLEKQISNLFFQFTDK